MYGVGLTQLNSSIMPARPKRPRLEKTVKLIDKRMYEDYNHMKPGTADSNEVENTPRAPLPNSGEVAESSNNEK